MTGPVLAMSSYWSYRAEMGLPVVTSIGLNRDFAHAPQFNSLKPWVLLMLDHLPVEERAKAYRASLWRRQARVEAELAALSS